LYSPIPGGTGNFMFFSAPSLDGGNVAFRGLGSDQLGIYTNIGGLSVVADTSTMIPGGMGNFVNFDVPSLDGGNVAFTGNDASQQGIYTNIGGSLTKVIEEGDNLDGKTVIAFFLGRESLSGNSIAFEALFTDGSLGIFIAELVSPPPPPDGDVFDPGDANADGFVNLADLGVIIIDFRGIPAPGNGDCNMDGFTNLADLGCVITVFRG